MSDGSRYESPLGGPDNNPFEVLGLLPEDALTVEAVRRHWRMRVNIHIAPSQVQGVRTHGPDIPTQSQANAAMQRFGSEEELMALRQRWSGQTQLSWDPSQAPGSRAAHRPPPRAPSVPQPFPFLRRK